MSDDSVKIVRAQAQDLMAAADSFVKEFEAGMEKQRQEMVEMLKKVKLTEEKEKNIEIAKREIAREKELLTKEKQSLRERTQQIQRQEEKLKEKLDKVQRLIES